VSYVLLSTCPSSAVLLLLRAIKDLEQPRELRSGTDWAKLAAEWEDDVAADSRSTALFTYSSGCLPRLKEGKRKNLEKNHKTLSTFSFKSSFLKVRGTAW